MGEPAFIYGNEDQRDRTALVHLLRHEQAWRTAGSIRRAIGMPGKRVRELCQIYPTLLVSSTEGYRLTVNATPRERMVCVQSLLSRSQKIMARASALASTL